jgi:cell division protein FtsA
MNEIVTAIDIGTTKIVALAGERDERGRVKILFKASVPTPPKSVTQGVVQNIEKVSSAIKEAVDMVEQQSENRIKFESVFVGIAGRHIKSNQNSHSLMITSDDEIIKQSDIDKLANEIRNISLESGEEIIDIIPQDYKVDSQNGITEPVGMKGRKITGNFHIIIGETTSAKNIKLCVEKLGIQVKSLYLEPIASAEAVLSEDEKEIGVAMVDIGGGTTDLAIYYEGILRHTAVIPFGGNVITKDIKEAYQILTKHAEELKIECGTALAEFANKESIAVIPGISGRDPKEISLYELAEIIQARMEEIIDILKFEIINSGFSDHLGAGIAVTGGGSSLKNLSHLINFRTGYDVKISRPANYASTSAARVNSAKLSTAVGLVILGFNHKGNNQVLFEKPKRKEKKQGKGIFSIFDDTKKNIRHSMLSLFDDEDVKIEKA